MFTKTLLLSALAASAAAQSYNATFVTGLAQFLEQNGLTSLAGAVNSSISSPGTMSLLNNINGTAKTLLAPTNTAFNGVPANTTSNSTLLGSRLAYHLLSGSFPASSFASSPGHTIARTYLIDPAYAQLEGNKSQALAFSIVDNKTQVLNQNTVVTITNTTSYQNLLIHIVDAVVDVPGTFSAAFATWNLTALPTVLSSLNLTSTLESARGVTIFAPNDQALANAQAALQGANSTQVAAIVSNHVISGNTVYSPLLGSGSYTSIGGTGFSFASNSSGTFVTSGSSTARVVQSDIITINGVMHIIDGVLANGNSNPAAASSAASAYASSATQGGQQTGAVGANPTETGPIGASNTGGGNGNAAVAQYALSQGQLLQMVAVVGAVMGGAVLLV